MQLVEQHVIGKNDSRWGAIDSAAFASKNLYNAANYRIRQEFIFHHRYLSYPEMDSKMQETEEYRALPAKVAQQVLIHLDRNWKSFFAALSEYEQHPDQFLGRPQLPQYKPKLSGRNLLCYTKQAISQPQLKAGFIKPSQLEIVVQTKQSEVNQVRIVPRKTHYVVEVVYERLEAKASVDQNLCAGVDMGLNNLAAVASNKPGFVPLLVNGRPLKAQNQFYNKQRALYQSQLPERERGTSQRIERLTDKRNRRINHELHTASRRLIDHLVSEGIGTLVIGKNPNWKQEVSLGKRNNQNFVSIPHARFVSMLSYKAQLSGIVVIQTEESYTSKCSFLDQEPIEKRDTYMGTRVHRGLFRSAGGRIFNADINGAFNIIRKVAPNAWRNGVEGVVVHPVKITL